MGIGKIVTISNKFTNKCHRVVVTISDKDCIVIHYCREPDEDIVRKVRKTLSRWSKYSWEYNQGAGKYANNVLDTAAEKLAAHLPWIRMMVVVYDKSLYNEDAKEMMNDDKKLLEKDRDSSAGFDLVGVVRGQKEQWWWVYIVLQSDCPSKQGGCSKLGGKCSMGN